MLKADKQNILNKRSEIVSACKHKRDYYFSNTKGAAASIPPTHQNDNKKLSAISDFSQSSDADDSSRMKQAVVAN